MLKLESIQNELLYKFRSEAELTKTINEMSLNFTTRRDQITKYISDEKFISAYVCFYLLTNIPKLKKSFEKMNFDLSQLNEFEYIDIGCGPGTFSFALLEQDPKLTIYGFEKSEKMIKQAHLLLSRFYPAAKVKLFSKISKIPLKQKTRFGVFGHSANEMDESYVLQLIDDLQLDNILFIEPGTKDFFHKSLTIREQLTKKFTLNYPCLSQKPCPLTGIDDWCHQYIEVTHEKSLERLSQLVNKDRRRMPVILNYYTRLPTSVQEDEAIIIRVYKPTKYSVEWQICMQDNILCDLEVPIRGFSKQEKKEILKYNSGAKIRFTLLKKLGDNKIRGKLL